MVGLIYMCYEEQKFYPRKSLSWSYPGGGGEESDWVAQSSSVANSERFDEDPDPTFYIYKVNDTKKICMCVWACATP